MLNDRGRLPRGEPDGQEVGLQVSGLHSAGQNRWLPREELAELILSANFFSPHFSFLFFPLRFPFFSLYNYWQESQEQALSVIEKNTLRAHTAYSEKERRKKQTTTKAKKKANKKEKKKEWSVFIVCVRNLRKAVSSMPTQCAVDVIRLISWESEGRGEK